MFDKSLFPIDPEKMMEMFKLPDITKAMAGMKLPQFDAAELMALQQKNMEALTRANKAAAEGYQALFKQQLHIFEQTMTELQAEMRKFDPMKSPADATKQAELARHAFEKAVENMTALAEAAQKANSEAMEIVNARVRDSLEELKAMSEKMSG
ncbi:MAG: phasin family protein [Alphaproteobacteria bacterium]|nr:MAG: phasin family protein [Alphaproteobacteria bacterium]